MCAHLTTIGKKRKDNKKKVKEKVVNGKSIEEWLAIVTTLQARAGNYRNVGKGEFKQWKGRGGDKHQRWKRDRKTPFFLGRTSLKKGGGKFETLRKVCTSKIHTAAHIQRYRSNGILSSPFLANYSSFWLLFHLLSPTHLMFFFTLLPSLGNAIHETERRSGFPSQ